MNVRTWEDEMFAVSRFTVNKKAQMFHSYSEIWLFAPSVCLVSLMFTVNKKAQMFAGHRFSSPAIPRFGCSLLLCVSFHC